MAGLYASKNERGGVMKSRKTLNSLIAYCRKHPKLRFWQAVYGWLNACEILIDYIDPYYFNGKEK